ncbi:GNAT family N-acetyltransferase [Clostridium sp. UBA4548]|uniref:GNAT family N-acetyltransferase n=1 Tax=Clostridium sp. UBA4548 TaxID=1946361 RepID=UPI0025BA6AE9|nr:GNAT family N-acetyltransferase [Clostridium sp. UBA4548]
MISMNPASSCDCEELTNLAIRSEAYWGYDSNYMDRFKEIYKVDKEFINNNPTYIIKENEDIVGSYGILISEEESALEYFFIEPKYIGKGYGRLLWNHAIDICKRLNIKEFEIVTSPQAKEFYIKMGAKYQGEIESLVAKERIIPRLVYKVI